MLPNLYFSYLRSRRRLFKLKFSIAAAEVHHAPSNFVFTMSFDGVCFCFSEVL